MDKYQEKKLQKSCNDGAEGLGRCRPLVSSDITVSGGGHLPCTSLGYIYRSRERTAREIEIYIYDSDIGVDNAGMGSGIASICHLD